MNHGVAAVLDGAPRSTPPYETLVEALEAGAAAGAPFVTFHGLRAEPIPMDFRATLDGAARWAQVFAKNGVGKGDRVLLLLHTGEPFVTALLGSMLAGAAPVPLAQGMTFGSMAPFMKNLAAIMANADPKVIVTHERAVEALTTAGMNRPGLTVLTEKDRPAALDPGATRWPSIGASDTALIQYTSGTTGRPKGVVISHRALMANTSAIAAGLEVRPGDVGASWLPMFHDMGLVGVLLTAVRHPYPMNIMSPERFAMGPQRWIHMLSETGATITAAPNFAYEMAVNRVAKVGAASSLATMRIALSGAEPVQMPTVRRFEEAYAKFGLRPKAMMPVYGMAECTLAVTFSNAGAGASHVGVDQGAFERHEVVLPAAGAAGQDIASVGTPIQGTHVDVVSDDGQRLSCDKVGRIRVKSESLMDGYFRNDEATANAIKDGWLDTGDLGFVHGGTLFVAGRADDLIIQGGRNVHPADVERVAIEVDGLRPGGVVAFGAVSETRGTQDIVVVAETAVRDAASHERMAREIRGEVLAALGVRVDAVHLWPVGAVPRTTSGKARRKDCARRVAETR